MKILDKSGREIKINDLIIYGHALGRCAGLRYGKVLDLKEVKDDYSDRINPRVIIIGADDDWGDAKLLSKKSTLLFPESRVLVVEEYQVPEIILQLLKNY